MRKASSSISPIINLYRIGALELLPKLFDEIWMPSVVLEDLLDARFVGYNVPSPFDLPWVQYADPQLTIPSVWVSLDLSSGEVAAIALAFENRDCVVLLDEPIGRKAAGVVGIEYWGTLQVLLEAKARGLIPSVVPFVKGLQQSGMWFPDEMVDKFLKLAGEEDGGEKAAESAGGTAQEVCQEKELKKVDGEAVADGTPKKPEPPKEVAPAAGAPPAEAQPPAKAS